MRSCWYEHTTARIVTGSDAGATHLQIVDFKRLKSATARDDIATLDCERSQTDTRGWSSYFRAMKRLAIAILVVSASSRLAGQSDRTLERISLALERSRSVVSGGDSGEAEGIVDRPIPGVPVFEPLIGTPKLGPFKLVAPQFRGEFVRLALPVGEYVSGGIRTLAAATRRGQVQAARRRVEADLRAWRDRAPKP